MFDAMVNQGRGGLEAFVALTATAPAHAFGLRGKGQIAAGMDADITIWDPEMTHTYGANDLKDNVGYNPYQGTTVKGMPVTVLSNGRGIVIDRLLAGVPGQGEWLPMEMR